MDLGARARRDADANRHSFRSSVWPAAGSSNCWWHRDGRICPMAEFDGFQIEDRIRRGGSQKKHVYNFIFQGAVGLHFDVQR